MLFTLIFFLAIAGIILMICDDDRAKQVGKFFLIFFGAIPLVYLLFLGLVGKLDKIVIPCILILLAAIFLFIHFFKKKSNIKMNAVAIFIAVVFVVPLLFFIILFSTCVVMMGLS